jgi:hypothetical protein
LSSRTLWQRGVATVAFSIPRPRATRRNMPTLDGEIEELQYQLQLSLLRNSRVCFAESNAAQEVWRNCDIYDFSIIFFS